MHFAFHKVDLVFDLSQLNGLFGGKYSFIFLYISLMEKTEICFFDGIPDK